jgi:hypothetical protein
MNTLDKLYYFLRFLCEKYDRDETFIIRGDYAVELISESNIDFGREWDAQSEYIQQLIDMEFVETVDTDETGKKLELCSSSKIKPTLTGIELIHTKKQSWIKRYWLEFYSSAIEENRWNQ